MMVIEKKPFVRYQLDENKNDFSKSIWMNKDMRQKVFQVGSMLRQSQISTIISQSLDIALANLLREEKMCDILYGNGMRNRRKGVDEKEIVQKELQKKLGNPDRYDG